MATLTGRRKHGMRQPVVVPDQKGSKLTVQVQARYQASLRKKLRHGLRIRNWHRTLTRFEVMLGSSNRRRLIMDAPRTAMANKIGTAMRNGAGL